MICSFATQKKQYLTISISNIKISEVFLIKYLTGIDNYKLQWC